MVLNCSTGKMIKEVFRVRGANLGVVVGVEQSHPQIQVAVTKLEILGLYSRLRLLVGNPTKLDDITALAATSPAATSPKFDKIIARNIILHDPSEMTTNLQYWKEYLSSTGGQIACTFVHSDCQHVGAIMRSS